MIEPKPEPIMKTPKNSPVKAERRKIARMIRRGRIIKIRQAAA